MNLQKFVPILRTVIIFGVFALLYVPFIVSNPLYFPYITGKAFYFRIITEIIFGVWLVLAVIDPQFRPKKTKIILSFAIFTVIIFIADWFGANRVASFGSNFERMEGFVTIAHLLALVLVTSSVFTKRIWIWFLNASTVVSLLAVGQAFSQISDKGFNYRIDTTLGNPIYLAVYMLFGAFITLWLLTQIKKEKFSHYIKDFRTWAYSIIFILQSLILFQTGTRGAMLGLLGGLLLAALLVIIFAKENPTLRKVFGGVLLAVLIFVGALFVFRDSDFIKNTSSLQRITTISASEGTGQARLWNWGIAWQGVKEKPLLGWGQSNYNIVYDKYFDPRMYEQEPWFDRTHNIILDWLIAGGFLGLLSYLAVIISALYVLWKKTNFTVVERSVITGLFAGYFVHNLFVFDNVVSYIFFAFILSFIASESNEEGKILQKEIPADAKSTIAVLILVATCFGVYTINSGAYFSATNLISAIQIFKQEDGKLMYNNKNGLDENLALYQAIIEKNTFGNPEVRTRLMSSAQEVARVQNLPAEMKQKFIDFAKSEMDKQIAEAPTDSRYPYILAGSLLQLGDIDGGFEYINKAIALAPKKQTFQFLLAQIYLNKKENAKAIEVAKYAYEMAPQLDTAWVNYASILAAADKVAFEKYMQEQISAGQFARVEKIILSQIARKPDSYQNYVSLSAVYFQAGQIDKSVAVLKGAIVKFPTIKTNLEAALKLIESGVNPVGKKF